MAPYPYERARWYVVLGRLAARAIYLAALAIYLGIMAALCAALTGCGPQPGEANGGNTGRGITCEWKESPNNVEKEQ
jgi:hypothetical protein